MIPAENGTFIGLDNAKNIQKLAAKGYVVWDKKELKCNKIHYYFGIVYCQSERGTLTAIDEIYGFKKWEIELKNPIIDFKHPYIFALTSENKLRAIDSETGINVWNKQLKISPFALNVANNNEITVLTHDKIIKLNSFELGKHKEIKLKTRIKRQELIRLTSNYYLTKEKKRCKWYTLNQDRKGEFDCSLKVNDHISIINNKLFYFEDRKLKMIDLINSKEELLKEYAAEDDGMIWFPKDYIAVQNKELTLEVTPYKPSPNYTISYQLESALTSNSVVMILQDKRSVVITGKKWKVYSEQSD